MNRVLLLVLLGVAPTARASSITPKPPARPHLVVDYVAPTKHGVIGAPADHIAAVRELMAQLDRDLRLPRVVTIRYRECGTPNSFYRHDFTIDICHELWDERRRIYRSGGFDDARVEQALRGAMTFTLFHELGHALHRVLGLPLVGRYEDAVDELATITMIGRGLDDLAAHAALGHFLRSRLPTYNYDVTNEHSSAGQRGFAIACLLYGANANRHAELVTQMKIPARRLTQCVRQYPHRVKTWEALLQAHVAR